MRTWILAAIVSSFGMGLIGCSDESSSAPSAPANAAVQTPAPLPSAPPPPPPPPPSPADDSSHKPAADPVIQDQAKTVASPLEQGTDAKSPASFLAPTNTNSQEIKLSAGVALPQTGPEGALMSFSVDYELPSASSNVSYVWVIERTQGKAAKIPAQIDKIQGNLMTFIPGWRANQGPFQTHLEDKNGKAVSASVELVGQE
jgi:hypothetical protein